MIPIKIAVVDDEIDIHEIFKINFRKEVKKDLYEVHYFANGLECVEFVRNHQVDILLILSDINMPVMDGFGLVEIIKKEFPHIDVFMISAYDDPEHIKKAKSLGASKYLTKPVDFDELKEMISEYQKELSPQGQ